MALSLDDFTVASKPKRVACSIAKVLAALDAKDADVLSAALGAEAVTNAAIAAVLEANGHKVSPGTVSRHRRNHCACGG